MATFSSAFRDLVLSVLIVFSNLLYLPFALWNCIMVGFSIQKKLIPKVVAITGANSGIGEGFAYAYAKDKCSLILIARNIERLEKVAKRCEELGARDVKIVQMDISDTKSVSDFFDEKTIEYDFDLFIANAGIAHVDNVPLLDQAEQVLKINTVGTIASINSVFKAYRKRGRGGQIACVSSLFGFINPPAVLSYGASKAATMGYTRDLRALGKDYNITVNTIAPGFIQTEMTAAFSIDQHFFISTEYLAQKVKSDLANDVAMISLPLHQYFGVGIISGLPPAAKQFVAELLHKYIDNGFQKIADTKDVITNKSQ